MEYLFDYLLFAAKLATVIALLAVPVIIMAVLRRARPDARPVQLEVQRLNDRLGDARLALEAALLDPKVFKQRIKAEKVARRKARADATRPRSFVLEFTGDMRAQGVEALREEITALLAVIGPRDEVVLVLESAGGTVHGYGLAASQLQRLRAAGVRLTVVVDRIAASGGYMMACVADEIVAAPFAILGSIGVVAQLPNFNRLLRKHDIDFEQVTAGEFKRTLTLFGENTAIGREKFQADIDDAHALFKAFVAEHRPGLDLAEVGTGAWWFGSRALEHGLVDRLATSDEIIVAAAATRDVYKVRQRRPRGLVARLTTLARSLRERLQA